MKSSEVWFNAKSFQEIGRKEYGSDKLMDFGGFEAHLPILVRGCELLRVKMLITHN